MNILLRNTQYIPCEAQYLVAGALGLDERYFGSNAGRSKYEILECLSSLLDISIVSAYGFVRRAAIVLRRYGKEALRNFVDIRVRGEIDD